MTTDNRFLPPCANDLFQADSLHSLPTPEPGEILYSWCARYHRISGSVSAIATSQRLFGSKNAGFVVDFPGRIGHFSTITASIFGNPDHLIRNYTLFALYAAFRPQQTMASVEELMLGNSVERVKFILGLPASRAATSHPLKFCPDCAHEELNDYGIAKWWRDHQWPSVWICSRHGTVLRYLSSTNKSHRVTSWITPDCLPDSTVNCIPRISDRALSDFERLAHLTSAIVQHETTFRPDILRIVFTLKLREFGWIRPSGTIDWPDLQDAFLTRFAHLEPLPGFDFIQNIRRNDFGSLGLMLRGSSRKQHPTKYLILIDFLFDSADQFFRSYDRHSSIEKPDSFIQEFKQLDNCILDTKIQSQVISSNMTLNSAATKLGIPVQRVISWAKINGFEYQKRPRKVDSNVLAKIEKLILDGASRSVISDTLNVSRKWVTAYLSRNPEKRKLLQKNSRAKELNLRRRQLQQILADHPGANIKAILSIPGNPFQWLKRNDRIWLRANLPFFDKRISP